MSAVTVATAALGTFAPGSGLYIHDPKDREAYAQKVIDAIDYEGTVRLAAKLWAENGRLKSKLDRLLHGGVE